MGRRLNLWLSSFFECSCVRLAVFMFSVDQRASKTMNQATSMS